MKTDVTYLGKIINVDCNSIEVEVSQEIPSSAPIIDGKIHRIGQIGTLVKVLVGNLTSFGMVSSVSNIRSDEKDQAQIPLNGSSFLRIELLGEKIGTFGFARGIGTYPTINDEVHLVLDEDLLTIYGNYREGLLEIGKHSSSDTLSVYLDLEKLVLRHCAILGSTGSGKSNTTANIIKNIYESYPGARIILVDTHGEYESAFKDDAKILKIKAKENPLVIPYWIMTFDELSTFLVERPENRDTPEDKRLREEILLMKKENAKKLKIGEIDIERITVDSPIPFDLKKLWYKLNREVNATYKVADENKQTEDEEELEKKGDANKLIPDKFKPYAQGAVAPYKSKRQMMYSYEKKIYLRLKDSRFNFLLEPVNYCGQETDSDIDELIKAWIDNDKRLTILDLNEVPFELIDITVGLITRLIFDSMYWGRYEPYTGRNRPLLMVFEEAHSYLPKEEKGKLVYARKAVERIFKEGRKFGVGAMVVTQRPSEISETILAQVGTFIALRLTNAKDQSTVKGSAPNNMSSLIDLLPSLRIGEAIIVGEAIQIPSRVRIDLVEPRPSSSDPELVKNWKKTFIKKPDNYKKIVTAMREQKHIGGK
jgi:hypothetical protein